MTKEQAQNYLRSSGFTEEQIRSIESAFTDDDCISRQSAIDVLRCGISYITMIAPDGTVSHPYDRENEVLEAAVDSIAALPSVTPAPNMGTWIPVSEKLPEIGQYVLCSLIKAKDVEHRVIICEYRREVWWSYVTAWMPLPKPYMVEPQENEEV